MVRRMTTILLVALLLGVALVGTALPVGAQGGCEIELEEAVQRLIHAQRQADQGNNFAALVEVNAAEENLAAILASCEGTLFPLPERFVAPDEALSFNYPEGWALDAVEENTYAVAPSVAVMNSLIDADELAFGPDDVILAVAYVDIADEYGADETFEDVVEDALSDIRSGIFSSTTPILATNVNGHAAYRVAGSGDVMDAVMVFVDFSTDEAPVGVLVVGFGAPGQSALLEGMTEAVANTVRVPGLATLRVPGVALADLRYDAPVAIEDVVPNINFRISALAPDGEVIAWYEPVRDPDGGQVCTCAFATGEQTCAFVSEDVFYDLPNVMVWSPNSRYMAFAGNFYRTLRETDLIIYDRLANEVRNVTDDGVAEWKPFGANEDILGPVWLDAVFTWGPDNMLYYVRLLLEDAGMGPAGAPMELHRLDPATGADELLHDLTDYFGPMPIYPSQTYSLDGVMSVSPDATQIALLVRESDRELSTNGVWVLDLAGDAPPVQVATSADLSRGMQPAVAEMEFDAFPMALTWDAGGTGLYVLADLFSVTETPGFGNAYYVDLKSETVTPLFDFSGYTDESEMITGIDPETGQPPMFAMPYGAALAPDFSGLLTVNRSVDLTGLSSLVMVAGQGKLTVLATSEERFLPSYVVNVAQDGTFYAYGYLWSAHAP